MTINISMNNGDSDAMDKTRRPNARTVGTRVCLANPSAIRCVQASKRVRAGDVARVAAKWQGVEMACRWRPLW